MRTQLTVALLAFSFLAAAAPKPLQYKTDVVVDGNFTEWAYPLPRTNKVMGINYDIANDNKNIYIFVRCTDKVMQNQIVSSGFEIWVNINGKKKKVTGITYPTPIEAVESTTTPAANPTTATAATTGAAATGATATGAARQGRNRGGADFTGGDMGGFGGFGGFGGGGGRGFGDFSQGNNSFVISKDMILQGFLIANGKQPARGNEIKTGIMLDADGFMLYELAIPFNTFYKEQLDADDANMKIAIGFVIKKAVTDPNTKAMMSSMRGMMGGMGGDMGGMGGGMSSAMMMGGMNSMNQEKKFWVVVTPTIK